MVILISLVGILVVIMALRALQDGHDYGTVFHDDAEKYFKMQELRQEAVRIYPHLSPKKQLEALYASRGKVLRQMRDFITDDRAQDVIRDRISAITPVEPAFKQTGQAFRPLKHAYTRASHHYYWRYNRGY